jgi:ferric-dicitrate binding protein FerR (iron transport regulator)
MGAKKERKAFREFIEASIANRRAWADSEDGRRALGPGSPTIPGLQDLHFILDWIKARDANR